MPTLTRLLLKLILVALAFYAVVYALATFVTPEQREISIPVLERDNTRQ